MPCRTRLVSGRIFKLSEDTAALDPFFPAWSVERE